MATFAVLNSNKVVNVLIAEPGEDLLFLGHVVEYTEDNPAGIDWVYNPETNTFTAPIAPVVEESNI